MERLGHVYVLRLGEGKWYVGYTKRGILRVIQHLRSPWICVYWLPEREGTSKATLGRTMYGRRCGGIVRVEGGFCKSHDKPKYRKLHQTWLDENKDSLPVGYEGAKLSGGGAKWTQKYPPEKWRDVLWEITSERTLEDENRTTLEYMREHGIENVRGGKWCMVDMRPDTVRELEELIAKMDRPPITTKASTYAEAAEGRKKSRR